MVIRQQARVARVVVLSVFAALLFFPEPMYAAKIGDALRNLSPIVGPGGLPDDDVAPLVGRFATILFSIVGFIFFLLLVYAGFRWILARGEENQIEDARKTLIAASIGLVIILSAYGVTVTVTSGILNGVTQGERPALGEVEGVGQIGCCLVKVRRDDASVTDVGFGRWAANMFTEVECNNYQPAPGTVLSDVPTGNPIFIPSIQDSAECSARARRQ